MRDQGVIMQTVPPHVADMIDYFATQYQVTAQQAVEVMIAMASAMLEHREPKAQYFATMMVDKLHKEMDTALLVAARSGT
jgi:propanediol dehydratase large subunit